MNAQNSTLNTFVRPSFFFIRGFSGIPYINYYYIFLCFVYIVSVLGNSFVMLIIYIDRELHTPKYIAIFNLAIADLCESTALVPNLINTFLFASQYISYEACLANMFFVFFFSSMQSVTLTVLAYDRFVAICLPLRYHAIVTNKSMVLIITVAWMFSATIFAVMVSLITRLSFCRSTVVDSFFCDHGPLYRLSCNDNSINNLFANISITIFLHVPIILIVLSYACILFALFQIASWEGRLKALKTCSSHLMLVAVFYIPVGAIYVAALIVYIHPNTRIINTSLSAITPPMLNPIIYSLGTEEIKEFIKKRFRRNNEAAPSGTKRAKKDANRESSVETV